MPYKVSCSKKKTGKKKCKIYHAVTGKVVGHSSSRRKAEISAWKRNTAHKK